MSAGDASQPVPKKIDNSYSFIEVETFVFASRNYAVELCKSNQNDNQWVILYDADLRPPVELMTIQAAPSQDGLSVSLFRANLPLDLLEITISIAKQNLT